MKQLCLGMIGVWGRAHFLKDYLHQGDEGESVVVAGADISDFALDQFRRWAPADALATKDYHELLAHPDIDAVVICTPDFCHEEHAIAASEADKDVYLEKPMALSTDGCDRILQALSRSGRKLMMGFCLRCSPVMVKAKQLIDQGVIGAVKAVWIRHFVGWGSDFYYHDWHSLRSNTNSLILQKGTHDLDLMHWLAGSYTRQAAAFGSLDMFGGNQPNDLTCDRCDEQDRCAEAQPLVDMHGFDFPRLQCAFRSEVDVEDNQVAIFELDNGVKGAYLQCHFTPEYVRDYTVIGTKGRLAIDLENMKITQIDRPTNRQRYESNKPKTTCHDCRLEHDQHTHGGADPVIAQAFRDYLLRGVEPAASALDGRMSVAAACAAVDSLREGGIRTVTPPNLVDTPQEGVLHE